ncbi:MAG: hypothetical protein Q9218_003351 [Villophora microphyllina]
MAESSILQLPTEIRRQIYGYYFCTITLTYPLLNHWLLTWLSRQGYDDALSAYYENVRFRFKHTYHFVEFASSLDHATLCRLRYISVKATPISIRLGPNASYYAFEFHPVLQLFPGLQLSVLEVQDIRPQKVDQITRDMIYAEMGYLIRSDGFRQLKYTSRSVGWILPTSHEHYPEDGHGEATTQSDRNVQPGKWDAVIKERDGGDSGAQVEAFRFQKGGRYKIRSWYIDFNEYDSGENILPEPGAGCMVESRFSNPIDVVEGRRDGVKIRVTRGRGVDYVQAGKSVTEKDVQLQDVFKRFTWNEMRERNMVFEVTEEVRRSDPQ